MQCPSCGQHSAEGKFCTSCGAQLEHSRMDSQEIDAHNSTAASDHYSTETHDNASKSNEPLEKLQTIGSDFGHFFMTLIRNPSEAKKANHTDMISGIISIVLFALFLAVTYHFVLSAIPAGFFRNVSIIDSLLLPFITFVLLELIIVGLTFIGTRLSVQAAGFPDILAKYGAYLIPFLLLYAAGLIFSLMGVPLLAGILTLISIFGFVLFAPTFILLEQPAKGFDPVYVLLGLYMITILAFGFFTQSFLSSILGSMMDSMFGGF